VANSRYRNMEIDVYDVLVQGDDAPQAISNAIIVADTKEYDILVVGRGGGSIEDLWAFNEEVVANAIFYAKTPIISAVGHEIDSVISDFVADVRAATPSVAMELALPDTNELYQYIDSLQTQMDQILSQKLHTKSQALEHLKSSFLQHSVEKKLTQKEELIAQLKENFTQSINFKLQGYERNIQHISQNFPQAIDAQINLAQNQLLNLHKTLESNNPKFKTKKGFAQLSQNEKVIDINILQKDEEFEVQSDRVIITAKVLTKEIIK